jgi:hypothetical protein
MERRSILLAALLVTTWTTALPAEMIPVRHIQRPMHRAMVARSDDGKDIATGDFTIDAATGMVSRRTVEKSGKIQVESKHMDLPNDLANGFVGTLLLNVPHNTAPFRVGMLAPVGGGRLIPLLISPQSEQTVQLGGQTLKATVFRVHPELNGFVMIFARLLGLQPKDVMVWVLEGEEPAVAVVVGQLGGYGPVVSSDLVGTSFGK